MESLQLVAQPSQLAKHRFLVLGEPSPPESLLKRTTLPRRTARRSWPPQRTYTVDLTRGMTEFNSKVAAVRGAILEGALIEADLSNSGLVDFPLELLWPARDSLELINLGGNSISSLPDEIRHFTKLRVLFFAGNKFARLPSVLGTMPSLYMLSFKSNCLEEVPEDSLSPSVGWLILTDNKIKSLPRSIGSLVGLRKCMLAANELTELPAEMSNCRDLELLRLAANKLSSLPDWLLRLPKLSWLAFAGNPFAASSSPVEACADLRAQEVQFTDLEMQEKLGEGASGVVYRAVWRAHAHTSDVAVKLFKSGATSDGLPEDEMKAMEAAGAHENCAGVLGRLAGAPDKGMGLVLPLLPPSFSGLGGPPSFQSVTRDTFPPNSRFSLSSVVKILKGVLSVLAHLHSKRITHGDVYAHNVLVDFISGRPVLSDFGAASFYSSLDAHTSRRLQGIEVRALGCLLDDLLQRAGDDEGEGGVLGLLQQVLERCMAPDPSLRPLFSELQAELAGL